MLYLSVGIKPRLSENALGVAVNGAHLNRELNAHLLRPHADNIALIDLALRIRQLIQPGHKDPVHLRVDVVLLRVSHPGCVRLYGFQLTLRFLDLRLKKFALPQGRVLLALQRENSLLMRFILRPQRSGYGGKFAITHLPVAPVFLRKLPEVSQQRREVSAVEDNAGKVVAILGCDYDASSIAAELQKAVVQTLQIGGICLILAILILTIIVSRITKGLMQVNAKIYDLVHNEGDLTQKLDVRSGDEMELIAGNVNELLAYIRKIMIGISSGSMRLMSTSRKMVDHLSSADESITDVSATMQEMSAAMEETTSSLNQITEAIDEIYSSVERIAGNADAGKVSSQEMESRASGANDAAEEGQKKANIETEKMAASLNEKIAKSKSVEQIEILTSNIIEITEQTNLLALNASIEAARAGEAGRGFAVVADEIGKLAGNSADAAAKIRQVSAEVIQAVDELAEGSQQMIEFVCNSTEEGFGGLVATSENYATDANAMRAMMEQFAQTAEELRSTMDGIRESISAVNIAVEESAKGIAGVSESSVQLTGNVNDIQSEASDNNGIAEDLATEVGKFKLE